MVNIASYLPDLLRLVKRRYPNWSDFSHPQFVEDEIEYKRQPSQLAKELLSREALEGALVAGDTDDFIGRLKTVAGKTNLLFLGVPQKGDLALINQPDVEPAPICRAIFELLHGPAPSIDRLAAFFDFVAASQLPQKWTFPTYYLFLLYPDSEIFVKPTVMNWFSKEYDRVVPFSWQPNAEVYGEMRTAFHALREELREYGARDMIDVQSFIWVAFRSAQKSAVFDAAVKRLRAGLADLSNHQDLVEVEAHKDEVVERYGTIFSLDHLPHLTADEFTSFLLYENNKHWTGINRYGSRLTQDMPRLREVLAMLHDETRPIEERFDEARQLKGLGKAVLTPILFVTHPDRYGAWNGKLVATLNELKLYPKVEGKYSEGRHYAQINDLLNQLAEELQIDLWTLDILWEWLNRQSVLAEPFASIFEDRDQAEWAFDFISDTVDRVGGSPNDKRFAMTLRHSKTLLRLNFGNWMLLDVSRESGTIHLALLIEPMQSHFSFKRWGAFAQDNGVAVFTIPITVAREWPPELQSIYETSMDHIAKRFRKWKGTPFIHSHRPEIFQALFDEEKRDDLLRKGLKSGAREKRYWRITLPDNLRKEAAEENRIYDLWSDCLRHGMAAISFDDNPEDPQIARFSEIQPGDKVVAFLRQKTIGGTGIVTESLDERVALERPTHRDFFEGAFWLRIGVDWQPQNLAVDQLPAKVRNKFLQGTVMELSQDEYQAVEQVMAGEAVSGGLESEIAREFKGFTADTFAFMGELQENNNKAWMEQNRDRWKNSVREPMRALFSDLGPLLKEKFDPYLVPDSLEIRPTAHHVLARIHKNWAARPDSMYHPYYWGAFYRDHLSRKSDAQLFITLRSDVFRFGFYFGDSAVDFREQFRRRVFAEPSNLLYLIDQLELANAFDFDRRLENDERERIEIRTAADLKRWVANGDFEMLQSLTPAEAYAMGPALADHVYQAFLRVFPSIFGQSQRNQSQ